MIRTRCFPIAIASYRDFTLRLEFRFRNLRIREL